MRSLINRFESRVLFSALGGFFIFGVLLVLSSGESPTGIEKNTDPEFALLGAMVLGFFANKFALSVDFADSRWTQRAATAVLWIAFLTVGSLAVWRMTGGEDLGLAGDGFHRDFEWWQAFAAVYGCFLAGLTVRWAVIGVRRIGQIFTH